MATGRIPIDGYLDTERPANVRVDRRFGNGGHRQGTRARSLQPIREAARPRGAVKVDKREALQILGAVLERFGLESYEALKSRIGSAPVVEEHRGPSGRWYQIELLFLWDDRRDGNVRVMGSIDDGGWRAFAPVTRSFIKPPDGQSAGE